jgi:hypothetical protein
MKTIDLRKERASTLRVGAYGINVGWECHRPFVSIDKYDDGCPDRVATFGGCRLPNGPGCEWECDGCLSINSALETADDVSDEDMDRLVERLTEPIPA